MDRYDRREQMALDSADKLLERDVDSRYIEEWTKIIREGKKAFLETKDQSILIFRLHSEWLGMSTSVFSQITEKKAVHTIPQKQSSIIKGLVNINGQMHLLFDLAALLGISDKETKPPPKNPVIYDRMIVIEKDSELWVFSVDEAFGIYQFDMGSLENVPVNVAKSSHNFLRGVFTWKGKSVGLIDEELLFYSLERSL